jgi:hypothetical protein
MGSISIPTIAAVGEGAADAAAADAAAAGVAAASSASIEAGAAVAATGASAAAASAGAGSVFTLANAATAASALGAAGSAVSARMQGVAGRNDAVLKARQAGLEAGQKQIDIRANMLRALASQSAQAGVGGIGTGGSFGASVGRQISQNQNDLAALSGNNSVLQQQYGQQGSAALTGGNIKAGASLLDFAGSSNGLG